MCCNKSEIIAVIIEGEGVRRAGGARGLQLSGLKKIETHVLVCVHKDCEKRGGAEALKELKRALKETGRRGRVMLSKVDCFDQCDDGPVMVVYPEGVWYGRVDASCAREIAERHVGGDGAGRPAGCRVLRDMRRGGGGGACDE